MARRWLLAVALLALSCITAASIPCKRLHPSDPKIACGVRGVEPYFRRNIGEPTPAASLNECRTLCIRRSGTCGMFRYNETADLCVLAHDLPASKITKDNSSDLVYYSTKCFDCPRLQCPSTERNFIDNGGFEASNIYIGPWSVKSGDGYKPSRHVHPSQPGVGSRNYLRCNDANYFEQTFRQCPGQVNKVEFDVSQVLYNRQFGLPAIAFGYPNQIFTPYPYLYRPGGPAGPVPETVRGFYTPSITRGFGTIDCDDFGGLAKISVDNIIVRPVDLSSAKFLSAGKVINPGFETGAEQPWKLSAKNAMHPNASAGLFRTVSPGLGGSKFALQWSGSSARFQLFLTPKLQNTTLQTGRNRLYRLTFDVDPPQTMSVFFKNRLTLSGSSNDPLYFYLTADMLPIQYIFFDFRKTPLIKFDNLIIREIEDTT